MNLGLNTFGILIEEVDGSLSGFCIKLKVTNGTLTNNGDGSFSLSVAGGSNDHGVLSGLGDDDHIQYGLLLGRAGGQTLIGGTGSGDNLALNSTSHATKGAIAIGSSLYVNEVNGRISLKETGSQDLYAYEGNILDEGIIDLPNALAGFIFITFDEGAE